MRHLAFVLLAAALVAGCTQQTPGQAVPTPDLEATVTAMLAAQIADQATPGLAMPTPDLEATVTAMLAVRIADQPTATATPPASPTPNPIPTLIPTSTPSAIPTPVLSPTSSPPSPTPLPTPLVRPIVFTGAGAESTPEFAMAGSPWILSWETFGTASIFMTIDLRDAETGEVVGPQLVIGVVFAPTFQTILVHGHVGAFYLDVNGPTLSDGGWRITVFDAPRA